MIVIKNLNILLLLYLFFTTILPNFQYGQGGLTFLQTQPAQLDLITPQQNIFCTTTRFVLIKKMSAQVIVVPLHLIVTGMHLCQTYPAQIRLIIMSK